MSKLIKIDVSPGHAVYINVDCVAAVLPTPGLTKVLLSGGEHIEVPHEKREELLDLLQRAGATIFDSTDPVK